jgi:UDP-3-O-[3-hydroxymyristoyl] N-acetylglucosamine deacetylase
MREIQSGTGGGSSPDHGAGQEIMLQHTLKHAIRCCGIGMHSGRKVAMTLRPAAVDSGIVFHRSDLGGDATLAASWDCAVETPLCTNLQNDKGVTVATVEHLMSALYGCGIDNAVIEIDGPEVPAMDGSAAPFVFLLECAGTVSQDAPRRALKILRRIAVRDAEQQASLSPGHGLTIHFEIDFESPAIGHQDWFVAMGAGAYKREVARARTFGFLSEAEALRARGLALGGSLENSVIIDGDQVLNEGGLRFHNEFVRHKVLDMIGDLYLAGGPVLGHASSLRGGHSLTVRLLKQLFAEPDAWTWTTATEAELSGVPPLAEPAMPPVAAARA